MSKIFGILLIVLGIGLIVLTVKKPAEKENNPLAADFRGYIGGGLFILIGSLILFKE